MRRDADPAAPEHAFLVEGLSVAYPSGRGHAAEVLHDVSLAVPRGGAFTIVGPSGSGKSTLLRCLNRLVEPTAGVVRFFGRDIRDFVPGDLRRRAALVMQTPVLFGGTVRTNLVFRPPGAAGDFSDARLRDILAEVALDPALLDRDALTLSGGERQRVTLARALLRDPQALLLDEPTSALDPPNAALVMEAVARMRDAHGLTIVAITHQPGLVRRLGGQLLFLVAGRVRGTESVDGDASGPDLDARLQSFLAPMPP